MLYENKNNQKLKKVHPADTLALYDDIDIPKYTLRRQALPPDVACRLIKNELLDEGNARLNLATFCTTFMEDQAVQLMAETLEKNAIDKSEYPSTIELENRCVNIIANLWHAPQEEFLGTSTVGSSEACMLAGLAMKFRWRERAERLGLDLAGRRPNLIVSSGYQVCWEKFCVYWDVELRAVPVSPENLCLDAQAAVRAADPYTIGIVGILGQTYTGKFDDIAALDGAVEAYNAKTEHKVFIHVDAASGGLYAPFIHPDLAWDFRLNNVVSINTSGHKYGLVYPGIGWVIWREKACIPEKLIFKVNYLGGTMPTMAINFSRSASQIIGQYYNFLRLGFEGYAKIHRHTQEVADYIAQYLESAGLFHLINRGESIPVLCFGMREEKAEWTLYDLSDQLEKKGWQLPVYPLPENAEKQIVCRIVCRSDLSLNLAERLVEDLRLAIRNLNETYPTAGAGGRGVKGFTH